MGRLYVISTTNGCTLIHSFMAFREDYKRLLLLLLVVALQPILLLTAIFMLPLLQLQLVVFADAVVLNYFLFHFCFFVYFSVFIIISLVLF